MIYSYPAVVVRVVDGDSLYARLRLTLDYPHVHVSRYLEPVYIRLAGVDCPESHERGGDAAAAFVGDLLPAGTEVVVVTDDVEDSFGRLLADVLLPGGGTLTEALLDAGHARPYEE